MTGGGLRTLGSILTRPIGLILLDGFAYGGMTVNLATNEVF
jgi:hypothetical protein